MNLLLDNWIATDRGFVSYRDILCADVPFRLTANQRDIPHSTLEILINLTQIIFKVQEQDRIKYRDNPMPFEVFDVAIKPFIGRFQSGQFMQYPQEFDATEKPLALMIPGYTPKTDRWVVAADQYDCLCARCATPLLYNWIVNVEVFSSHYQRGCKGGNGGAVIVSFNEHLRTMIWNNVLNIDNLRKFEYNVDDGPFTWEEPVRCLNSSEDLNKISMNRALFWNQNMMRLILGGDKCAICGGTEWLFKSLKRCSSRWGVQKGYSRPAVTPGVFRHPLCSLATNKNGSLKIDQIKDGIGIVAYLANCCDNLPYVVRQALNNWEDDLKLLSIGYLQDSNNVLLKQKTDLFSYNVTTSFGKFLTERLEKIQEAIGKYIGRTFSSLKIPDALRQTMIKKAQAAFGDAIQSRIRGLLLNNSNYKQELKDAAAEAFSKLVTSDLIVQTALDAAKISVQKECEK